MAQTLIEDIRMKLSINCHKLLEVQKVQRLPGCIAMVHKPQPPLGLLQGKQELQTQLWHYLRLPSLLKHASCLEMLCHLCQPEDAAG